MFSGVGVLVGRLGGEFGNGCRGVGLLGVALGDHYSRADFPGRQRACFPYSSIRPFGISLIWYALRIFAFGLVHGFYVM